MYSQSQKTVTIDGDTGVLRSNHNSTDFGFHKVDARALFNAMMPLSQSSLHVCFHILMHMKRDNTISFVYADLEKKLCVAHATLSRAIQELMKADLIQKVHQGCYMVNPNLIFYGSSERRMRARDGYFVISTKNQGRRKPQ